MTDDYKELLRKLYQPPADSHKGQNGKVLIIGGSSLFHAASLWAAEVASHLNDMVHYSSIEENNKIMLSLKEHFRNGIVVSQSEIPAYVAEDDAILVGPGMVRSDSQESPYEDDWEKVLTTEDEGIRTRHMVHYLVQHFPEKRFVFDAGALQMMDSGWLKQLRQPAIITPHQLEFERFFGEKIEDKDIEQKKEIVKRFAKEYNTIILLKAVVDIISDGHEVFVIEGGNAGLTKGGTGDVLAGTVVSFYAKNDALLSCIAGSVLIKKTAEELGKTQGTWYNVINLIDKMPEVLKQLLT